ncbi:hypothetical protein MHM88_05165 [Epibacterium sp. MM17-32]|uniref:hypothetical protein n=1 Tax=Epibacterium sp. MM17-32 TaxID=2917734 RepID=UPI001EF6A671|nr:hypothetical protein [Epibacterium sp. MM17-32]MCG7627186.1 hypothetical protein [Epibacterium sp. MM17-32]
MQQLKRKQQVSDVAHATGFTPSQAMAPTPATPLKPAQTRIETVSSSGNVKVALKRKPAGGATASTTAASPANAGQGAPAGPQSAPEPVAPVFSDPEAYAAGRSRMPLLMALGAASLLALGLVSFTLFTGNDQAHADVAAATDAPDGQPLPAASAGQGGAQSAADPGASSALAAAGSTAAGEDLIAKMTQGTLAALRSGAASPAAAPAAPATAAETASVSALYQMVMTAHAQGQSEAYIDQLLNDAHARQQITVPEGLIGADGRVDTATILSLLIQK